MFDLVVLIPMDTLWAVGAIQEKTIFMGIADFVIVMYDVVILGSHSFCNMLSKESTMLLQGL